MDQLSGAHNAAPQAGKHVPRHRGRVVQAFGHINQAGRKKMVFSVERPKGLSLAVPADRSGTSPARQDATMN
jgi:hypothetical protein